MELHPDPVRMAEGLRDTGYQFNTAVADVVDNSIASEATFVDIQLNIDLNGEVTLAIYDDGIGMDRDGLINAMKYGSKPRPSAASLGKFGLGLKTASTAAGPRMRMPQAGCSSRLCSTGAGGGSGGNEASCTWISRVTMPRYS